MPFHVTNILFDNFEFQLNDHDRGGNYYTIIVGKNGVGKSRLLAALASKFIARKIQNNRYSETPRFEAITSYLSIPNKVITQTFSPFSRFPRAPRKNIDLKGYFIESEEKYSAIGFTKHMAFSGSVSRDSVGRIVRRLITSPEHALPLKKAMNAIGFSHIIRLGYRKSPIGQFLDFDKNNPEILRSAINNFLLEFEKKSSFLPEESRLSKEMLGNEKDNLAEIIFKSVASIQLFKSEQYLNMGPDSKSIYLELDIENIDPRKLEFLKSIITLNRLGLLRLSDCFVNTLSSAVWSDTVIGSSPINLVDASSGEQQLLSSLFGIVAEAENDSLILIDEPELSLHPEWQTQVIDLIRSVMNVFSGCHIFIATHSALVAQRAKELEIEVLTLGNEIELAEGNGKNISIEQVLLEIFGLATKDSSYVPRLIFSLVMKVEDDDNQRSYVLNQLNILKSVYANSKTEDSNIEALIQDAFDVIQSDNKLYPDDTKED